ncbi:RNA polymerase subunit Rpo13 [Hyperthermus butylicus]|uniref:RNA polymerase Rpo13 subunit HTH domain-containing protein n=1 Tax=Hyperthermus butylicus (strain DSM 5456 / JCM 9403 / PLM1-5) TaxID=415426 RepID=A2BMA7_HYPBU|nr:RNA polymerase subunit Rpo13 [Hyperthermus butylicus]ABM81118.1 hypothetical protein Hbut_1288 [Hyperthermus butylicus DSM 5456]
MSEEEFVTEPIEEGEVTITTAEEEAEEEVVTVDIDVNAALLEAMVARTEIIEKLAKGEYRTEEAITMLQSIAIPSLEKRRRARKK